MANTNTIQTRILLKSDITANWEKATNFIPKKGEACIYLDRFKSIDSQGNSIYVPGIKVGDGNTPIGKLLFLGDDYITTEQIQNLMGMKYQNSSVVNI